MPQESQGPTPRIHPSPHQHQHPSVHSSCEEVLQVQELEQTFVAVGCAATLEDGLPGLLFKFFLFCLPLFFAVTGQPLSKCCSMDHSFAEIILPHLGHGVRESSVYTFYSSKLKLLMEVSIGLLSLLLLREFMVYSS